MDPLDAGDGPNPASTDSTFQNRFRLAVIAKALVYLLLFALPMAAFASLATGRSPSPTAPSPTAIIPVVALAALPMPLLLWNLWLTLSAPSRFVVTPQALVAETWPRSHTFPLETVKLVEPGHSWLFRPWMEVHTGDGRVVKFGCVTADVVERVATALARNRRQAMGEGAASADAFKTAAQAGGPSAWKGPGASELPSGELIPDTRGEPVPRRWLTSPVDERRDAAIWITFAAALFPFVFTLSLGQKSIPDPPRLIMLAVALSVAFSLLSAGLQWDALRGRIMYSGIWLPEGFDRERALDLCRQAAASVDDAVVYERLGSLGFRLELQTGMRVAGYSVEEGGFAIDVRSVGGPEAARHHRRFKGAVIDDMRRQDA